MKPIPKGGTGFVLFHRGLSNKQNHSRIFRGRLRAFVETNLVTDDPRVVHLFLLFVL